MLKWSDGGSTYLNLPLVVNAFENCIEFINLLHGISWTGVMSNQDEILHHCKVTTTHQNKESWHMLNTCSMSVITSKLQSFPGLLTCWTQTYAVFTYSTSCLCTSTRLKSSNSSAPRSLNPAAFVVLLDLVFSSDHQQGHYFYLYEYGVDIQLA